MPPLDMSKTARGIYIEVEKPFAFENELKEKTERLNTLNIELNEKDNAVIEDEPEQNDESAEKKSVDRERRNPVCTIALFYFGQYNK